MTDSSRISDRTERCLARAIELLEAADDLDKLYGEPSEQLIERTKAEVSVLVEEKMCKVSPGIERSKNRVSCQDIKAQIGMNSFKHAHDTITREALLGLIDCIEEVEPDAPESDIIDNKGNIVPRSQAEQEKRRDNEDLSKGGRWE